MTRLDDTQQLFFRAITWPRGVSDFLAQADDATVAMFDSVFGQSEQFSRMERVDVYANAYFHRLLGALEEMLPRLAFLCEPVGFHNLITDYVLACPSELPDLRRFGDRLPAFLAEHPLGQKFPLLPEVARVELALSDALDAPDCSWVTTAQLQAQPPECWPELQFALAPAVRLTVFHWNWAELAALVDARKRTEVLQLQRKAEPKDVLVARGGHAVTARTLPVDEAGALRLLARGTSFGETCELVSQGPEAMTPATLVKFLGGWLAAQVLCWPDSAPPTAL